MSTTSTTGITYSMRRRLPPGVCEQTARQHGCLRLRWTVRDKPGSHPDERSHMAGKLDGKTVAFMAAEGVEQVELTEPWKAVEEAGGKPELISTEGGDVQAFNHLDKGDTFAVDHTVADADPGRYDALVLPGGVANPDFLRTRED